MKKKQILVLFLTSMIAMSIMLTGCMKAENEAKTGEGPITIRVTWWGSQARNDGTIAALDAYTAENPNVVFEVEFSDWTGYWDKLATQAASNSLPDIIQQDYAYIAQWQSRNQLASLDEFIESGILDLTNVPDSIMASGSLNGEVYALCAGMNAPTMTYDKLIVEEAGVTIPEQMTYEEFEEIAKTIYEKTGVHASYPTSIGVLVDIQRNKGEKLINYDENSLAIDEETVLQLYKKAQETIAEDWHISMELMIEKNDDNIETKPIVDQTTWMTFAFSNQYPTIGDVAGREMGLSMALTTSDATSQNMFLKPSQFFSITETSKVKEEAAKVLNYLTNSKVAQDALQAERGVPISTEMLNYIKPQLTSPVQGTFDFIIKVGEVGTPIDPPNPPGYNELSALHSDLVELVRYGEITPEKATARFMSEGNEILARAAS